MIGASDASIAHVLVVGCGYVGRRVATLALDRGLRVTVTEHEQPVPATLVTRGAKVLTLDDSDASADAVAESVDAHTFMAVTIPPDGATDARIASRIERASSVTLISTTGVYGSGIIDDATPVSASPLPRARARLDAERVWQQLGACVLRAPSIYGPDRGLHVRIARGKHLIPGDGSGFTSRIHADDLAELVMASAGHHGETFVVGDHHPCPHIEVVRWICETHHLPMPGAKPLDSVHETLRASRRVDATRALETLGVTLIYPTFRDGMATLPPELAATL